MAGGRRRPRSAAAAAEAAAREEHHQPNSTNYGPSAAIPYVLYPSGTISPNGSASVDTSSNAVGGYRRRTILFAALLVTSVVYNDTPITPSLRSLMFETGSEDGPPLPASTSASGVAAAAPAFSTSHGREIALFGGTAWTGGGMIAETGSRKKEKFERNVRGQSPQTQQQVVLPQHQQLEKLPVRKFGQPRRPKLAHARDANYQQQQYPQPVQRPYNHQNGESSSKSDAPQQRKHALQNLHPRERVISEVGGARSAQPGVATAVTYHSDGDTVEGADAIGTKSVERRARFVLQDLPDAEADPYQTTQLNGASGYPAIRRGNNGAGGVVMTVLGVVVGLGAALFLGVLLFLSDGRRKRSATRMGPSASRSVRGGIRSSNGRNNGARAPSSSSGMSSGSISLDSIEEEDPTNVAAVSTRRRQRDGLSHPYNV